MAIWGVCHPQLSYRDMGESLRFFLAKPEKLGVPSGSRILVEFYQ